MTTLEILNTPGLLPTPKYPDVLTTFDNIPPGDSFIVVNDHDLTPFLDALKAERGETFIGEKIDDGPEKWKVKITKTGSLPKEQQTEAAINLATKKDANIPELNVTLLEPTLKHPAVFKQFDELPAGGAFYIFNDHDPKPLYYQMIAERGNIFTWSYEQKGPQTWKVLIQKNAIEGPTLGELAAADIRKAEVFKKYGLDFCCGGKKSLRQACEDKSLNITQVEQELQEALQQKPVSKGLDFNRWELDFLADYIYNEHHKYFYDEDPVIADLLDKVVAQHVDKHPFLKNVSAWYIRLQNELNAHFLKEEKIIFPHIKDLVLAKKTNTQPKEDGINDISGPLQMMEAEHEVAGEILEQINGITNYYTPPADACNSFNLLYQKLKALEEDLHQHIHLENNILFPKAAKLEKELKQTEV